MPRAPRPRPLGEYLAVLARIIRQIDADKTLPAERAQAIKKALGEAMQQIQAHLAGS